VVATFLVQTHVGYALPAATLVVFGVGGLVWCTLRQRRARRSGRATTSAETRLSSWRGWIPTMASTLAVIVVMWFPPGVQQLTNHPGNIGKLVAFFRAHGQEHSATAAWHVLSAQFGVWPDWLSGHVNLGLLGAFGVTSAAPFPVVLVLIGVAAAVCAWRRRY